MFAANTGMIIAGTVDVQIMRPVSSIRMFVCVMPACRRWLLIPSCGTIAISLTLALIPSHDCVVVDLRLRLRWV